MTLSDRYRRLARLIDALESQGLTVRSAAPADELASEETSGERIPIRLELELPSGTTLDQLVETTQEPTASDVDGAEPDVSHPSTRTERTTRSDAADHSEPSTPANDGDSGESVSADDVTDTVSTDTVDDSDDSDDVVSTTDDSDDSDDVVSTTDDSDESDDAPEDDGATDVVSCTHPECDRTFETDRGMKIHRTKAHSLSELIDGGADEAVHCDPDVLAEVYEEYDTFAEMTEALDVDVGPQAVRKQMIRHDIHEPGLATPPPETNATNADVGSGDTQEESVADGGSVVGADAAAAEPNVLDEQETPDASEAASPAEDDDATVDDADPVTDDSDAASVSETGSMPADGGESDADADADADSNSDDAEESLEPLPDIELPASLTLEEFRTAVEEATTLYDVQRALDLDRETSQELLRKYDLLELVCGRAATVSEREKLKTEIHERLQRATT